jgi:hypothetical protein
MPRQRLTYDTSMQATGSQSQSTSSPGIRQRSNRSRPIRDYGPTRVADNATSGVGLLEAEYFLIVFLLILELFVGSDSYADKMISTMKRGTLVTLLFFILAMVASVGPNASKISKGIGGLVVVGILLSSPGNNIITALDNFVKADWQGSTGASADTGTQQSTGGAISQAEGAASNSANTITEINLPGIGPVFAIGTIANSLKRLFHL